MLQEESKFEHVCQIHVPDFPKFVVAETVKFLYTGSLEITSQMKNLMQEFLVRIIRIDANLVLPDSQEPEEELEKNIPTKISKEVRPTKYVGQDEFGNLVNLSSTNPPNDLRKTALREIDDVQSMWLKSSPELDLAELDGRIQVKKIFLIALSNP